MISIKQFDLVHAEANIFNITSGSIKNYPSTEAQSANMGEERIRIDKFNYMEAYLHGFTTLHREGAFH